MAFNKLMLAALKAISYPDIDVKRNYKLERQFINIAHYHYLKGFYTSWDHKVSCEGHDIPVRIFAPDRKGHFPVLLFFHGGGWVTGNINSYDRVCTNLAKYTNHTVISVDYRLAPEHKFPAGLHDCYAVAREIFLNSALLEVSTDEITLIGDSAGGNLAAAVSLMAHDRGEFAPKRQILIYPATYYDHTETSPFTSIQTNGTDYFLTAKKIQDYMTLYKSSDEDLKNPYLAPLLAKDLSGQPKTLVVTAEYDPLRDEGEEYGKQLIEQGNTVQIYRVLDALHGFFSLPPNFAQVKEVYGLINQFIENNR